MPSWCLSYIQLGIQVAQIPRIESRHVVALAIPTRMYASVFVALGVVFAGSANSDASEEYFRFIASQPIGTPVVYRRRRKKLRGVIEGFEERDSCLFITIKTGNRERISFPLRENVAKIVIAERDFKLQDYQKGSKVVSASDFLRACVKDADSFVTQTQLECLIVSRLSCINTEVTTIILGLETGDIYISGNLQEILRVKQFLGAHYAYRCQVVPTSTGISGDNSLEIQNPPIVILDGANAYLKHSAKWGTAHQIVMLDRTERMFQEAVDSLNQGYTRRIEYKRPKLTFDLPSGVDAIVYQEKTNETCNPG